MTLGKRNMNLPTPASLIIAVTLASMLLVPGVMAQDQPAPDSPVAESTNGQAVAESVVPAGTDGALDAGDLPESGTLEDTPVLPEAMPDGEDDTGAASETRSLRKASHRRMLELLDEKRYAEAVEAARETVRLTELEFGSESIRLAAPLDNLATSQMLNGDLLGSEANYQRSIALIQQNEGILSPRLVNPFVGLGATYNRAGLYDQATDAFEKALRINHVNEGFYNFEQFKIRDGLTESYIGLREIDEANFQQESQAEIRKRKFGAEDPRVVEGLYKLARWYERSGQLEDARLTYQSAERILRNASGKDDAVLVDALIGIAGTYRLGGLMSESASALKKALNILDKEAEPDRPRRADVLIRLGDLYTSSGKPKTARTYYEDAWQELSVDEADADLRAEYFDQPVRVSGLSFRMLDLAPGVNADDESLSDGVLMARYSVDDTGRVGDITIIEADPAGLLEDRLVYTLERSRFRPRFESGLPIASEGLLHQQDFRYRPGTAALPENDADADNSPSRTGGRLEYPGSAASGE